MKKQLLKKLCIAFIGVIGISSTARGQHWLAEVSGQVATFNGEYKGNHLAVDAAGNTYTTGSFKSVATEALSQVSAYSSGQTHTSGVAAFTASNSATSATKDNSFIVKTNASGAFEWMLGFGSTATTAESTITNTIAVDANNTIYAGGRFNGTLALTNTFQSVSPASNPTANGTDGLVLKVTTAGAYVWHKILGGSGTQTVMGVTSDSDGNLIVVGAYDTELIIDATKITAKSGNGTDVFIAKFQGDGTLIFVKSIGGTGADAVNGLAVDIDKSIYMAGNFVGTMIVRPDDAATNDIDETLSINSTATNPYLAKFDANGNAVWAKAVLSASTNVAYSIAVDHKSTLAERKVYLTGHLNSSTPGSKINFAGVEVELTNGNTSPFISKFRADDGTGVWGKIFNSNSAQSGGYLVSVNANNEAYFGGFGRGTLNIEGTDYTMMGNGDGYIVKVDENGNIVGKKFIVTSGTDYVCGLVATNSAIYANGIAGGPSGGTVASPTFTPNFAETGQDYTFRGGSWDIYILKWGDATLPISLSEFKGNKTSSGNLLTWSTLSETGNQYFELERSIDGVNFSAIKRIAGAGTSSQKQSYSYLDSNPLAGVNYYRLKQVDKDGAFSYSKEIVALNNQIKIGELKLYPNPGSGIVTVQLPSESAITGIKVYDQIGKLVRSHTDVSGMNYTLDISEQAAGIYFIQVLEKGKSNLIKYIKQ